jgi:hypothetical protein
MISAIPIFPTRLIDGSRRRSYTTAEEIALTTQIEVVARCVGQGEPNEELLSDAATILGLYLQKSGEPQ